MKYDDFAYSQTRFKMLTKSDPTRAKGLFLVIGLGLADFLSAFFFGFTSSPGSPLQLFHPEVTNNLILFPTGMVPMFLEPRSNGSR